MQSLIIQQELKLCFFLNRIDNNSTNNFWKQKSKLIIKTLHLIMKVYASWECSLIVNLNLPHILIKEYVKLEILRFRLKI